MGGETRLKPRLWLLLVLSGCLRSQLARAQDQQDGESHHGVSSCVKLHGVVLVRSEWQC